MTSFESYLHVRIVSGVPYINLQTKTVINIPTRYDDQIPECLVGRPFVVDDPSPENGNDTWDQPGEMNYHGMILVSSRTHPQNVSAAIETIGAGGDRQMELFDALVGPEIAAIRVDLFKLLGESGLEYARSTSFRLKDTDVTRIEELLLGYSESGDIDDELTLATIVESV